MTLQLAGQVLLGTGFGTVCLALLCAAIISPRAVRETYVVVYLTYSAIAIPAGLILGLS